MYKIKTNFEDFIVTEVSAVKLSESGIYAIYELKKKNMGTEQAIQQIVKKLDIKRKQLGYAGLKDKFAITTQLISINRGKKTDRIYDNFSLKFLGWSKEPISLGDLKENKFEINVEIDKDSLVNFKKNIKRLEKQDYYITNYFGPQRFSKTNHIIGELLVKKKFLEAANELNIQNHVKITDNPIKEIRSIPKKILTLFVSSFQSLIFNEIAKKLENLSPQTKLPLVGFGTNITNSKWGEELDSCLNKYDVTPRSFIIPQIPELSSYGTHRTLGVKVKDFKYGINKKIVKLKFSLKPGSYATVVAEFLFGD